MCVYECVCVCSEQTRLRNEETRPTVMKEVGCKATELPGWLGFVASHHSQPAEWNTDIKLLDTRCIYIYIYILTSANFEHAKQEETQSYRDQKENEEAFCLKL